MRHHIGSQTSSLSAAVFHLHGCREQKDHQDIPLSSQIKWISNFPCYKKRQVSNLHSSRFLQTQNGSWRSPSICRHQWSLPLQELLQHVHTTCSPTAQKSWRFSGSSIQTLEANEALHPPSIAIASTSDICFTMIDRVLPHQLIEFNYLTMILLMKVEWLQFQHGDELWWAQIQYKLLRSLYNPNQSPQTLNKEEDLLL